MFVYIPRHGSTKIMPKLALLNTFKLLYQETPYLSVFLLCLESNLHNWKNKL